MPSPVNDLAQWWIWRLEIKVLGAVGAALLLGLWALVYAITGNGSLAWAVMMAVPVTTGIICLAVAGRTLFSGSNVDRVMAGLEADLKHQADIASGRIPGDYR